MDLQTYHALRKNPKTKRNLVCIMKIGDIVIVKSSFEFALGVYKGATAKIVGKNPYYENIWNIEIIEGHHKNSKINNVKEKDLELLWSVS